SYLYLRDGDYTFAASSMTLTIDGVATASGSAHTTDGKLHKAKVTYTSLAKIAMLGGRYSLSSFYDGILADPVSTISGSTQTFTLGNSYAQGDTETSAEGGNSITRYLVPSTNIEQYTLTDGSWIGDELVTQSIWENPESYGSQWTFANNQWTLTGDGSLSALQLISTAEQELEIRVEGTASNITGDVTATANSLTEVTASYSFDTTDLQQYKRWNGSVATVTLNKPSIKHKIEVAQ
ncbi:MAG: hypothetical protein GY799_14315, partial [Desulfobulbaceae bacterium]|nr:hypothetical protein [Desulfobulbaceae bacterium]